MQSYAIVGLGHRATLYLDALTGPHAEDGRLVGLCDLNLGRAERAARVAKGRGFDVPVFSADGFDRMIAQQRPDRVIVTVPDNIHACYIERALELGCDVITEKPLTMDAASCGRILAARRRTGRSVIVGFNYRYSPVRTLVKQALMSGIIGHVQSATFEWQLDTHHGADYFRRWHRTKANSGGLLVHKATHHFDVLNWWLGAVPRRVTALGRRVFYRPEIGDALGFADRGVRCTGCPAFARCGFRLDVAASAHLTGLYAENEHHDGYLRDLCVFSPDIDIEDQMQALIEYDGGVVVNYTLTAYNPCEGHRVVFNGTRGRLELLNIERGHVQPDGRLVEPPVGEINRIRVQPHFGRTYELAMPEALGAHGGGDVVMLRRLLGPPGNDEYGHTADDRAGAWSALVGIAANESLRSGAAVVLQDLLGDVEVPDRVGAPFGPAAIWQHFEPERYPFLKGATMV
jgi:predicted dehydrogenase